VLIAVEALRMAIVLRKNAFLALVARGIVMAMQLMPVKSILILTRIIVVLVALFAVQGILVLPAYAPRQGISILLL
jgi:hypothetical protein